MKKIILFILLILPTKLIYANELLEITEETEIHYKWYKEKEEGRYYSKMLQLEGYQEDTKNVIYGEWSNWNEDNCYLSKDNYQIENKTNWIYRAVKDTNYIKLINFVYNNNIIIFNEGVKQEYKIISNKNNELIIKLNNNQRTYSLMLYIEYELPYEIIMSYDELFNDITLTKKINGEKILIPDENWKNEKTKTMQLTSINEIPTGDLIIFTRKQKLCRYREIKTYRYKIEKEYYDDEYHLNVSGYIPDYTDFKIYTNKITNNPEENESEDTKEEVKEDESNKEETNEILKPVEIIKEIKIPYKEKEYITKYQNIFSEPEIITKIIEKECNPEIISKKEYIEIPKKIKYTPKIIYIIILFLSISILILICKKMSFKNKF